MFAAILLTGCAGAGADPSASAGAPTTDASELRVSFGAAYAVASHATDGTPTARLFSPSDELLASIDFVDGRWVFTDGTRAPVEVDAQTEADTTPELSVAANTVYQLYQSDPLAVRGETPLYCGACTTWWGNPGHYTWTYLCSNQITTSCACQHLTCSPCTWGSPPPPC
jgi:hypothetical protein